MDKSINVYLKRMYECVSGRSGRNSQKANLSSENAKFGDHPAIGEDEPHKVPDSESITRILLT